MNQILYSKNMRKTKVMVMFIILIFLLLIFGFLGLGFISKNSDKILRGVSIGSIDVSNMTEEEATKAMDVHQKEINNITYVLVYGNREVSVNGDEIGLRYDKALINEVSEYGKNGTVIENSMEALKSIFNVKRDIKATYSINEDSLGEKLAVLLEEENAVSKGDTYEVSGDKIIVLKGHDGVTAKIKDISKKILENVSEVQSQVRVEVDTELEKAARIDFAELYNEIYIAKQNASYEKNESGKMEYIREVIGVSFDIDAAEAEYLNLEDDEKMVINLIKETPDITTANLDEVLYGDKLATFKTVYNASNKNRSTNLEIAGRKINGTILMPGEEFSYNKVVGQRTAANGFKEAHVFAGGKVVDGLGGGICQVSSTLYNAVLLANLEVTERKNHMMHTGYVEPSLDATVVWGSIDFRFKNNRETPIKIVATVKNGTATVTIYGKKMENEPDVEIKSVIEKTIPYTTVTEYDNTMPVGTKKVVQDPMNGYVSKAYKILKDKDGKETKVLISSDTYKQTSMIIKVGTKNVEPTEVKPQEPEMPIEPSIPESSGGNIGNNNNNNASSEWPTGWDSPENPYYTGNI